jgi:hypothetical protein
MPVKSAKSPVTAHELSALPIAEQLTLLSSLDARGKSRLLLEAANGADLMARMPTQEVYLMAVERGPEQLPELLGLATPEQWTGFIDLDCWDGDDFNTLKASRWLATLLENDEATVFNVLRQLDFEQLCLLLKCEMEILSGLESIEDDDARVEAVRRDGGYEISYHTEAGAKLYGRLIEILQGNEVEFFLYLMEAVRSESKLSLEESVYQQRCGRLADMAIPDPIESLKVFSWLDPQSYRDKRPSKLAPGGFDGHPPAFMLTLVRPGGLLGHLLAAGIDDALCWELANLTNKVLVAERIGLGDLAQVSVTLKRVDACLNLALEWLAGDDVELAGECFRDCYTEDLFRLGYSLTLGLQRRAAPLGASSVAPYLDGKAKACLSALAQRRPLYYEGIGDPTRGGERLFERLAEVEAAQRWLERIELQRRLFEDGLHFVLPAPETLDLSGCQPGEIEDITLVEFFLTALSNKLLGRDFQPSPIAEEELAGLHGMVSQGGGLHPRLREETVRWLDTLAPGGGDFGRYCLDIWAEEFCAIGFEDIDPRYIGGLIVRLAA